MPTYQFIDGFRPRAVTASVAHQELEHLRKVGKGKLTASKVFEASRPVDAPLHDEFVWDGDAAIRELGHQRARTLVRAVVCVDKPEQAPVRVYAHVPSEAPPRGEGYYAPMVTIVQQPDAYALALDALLTKFRAAEHALGELRHAAGQQAPERVAVLAVAQEAFSAARAALEKLSA